MPHRKMVTPGFTVKRTYYTGTVYEWNLPTGSSCPFARGCLVTVDRNTGKFDVQANEYRCYAAAAERFPAVRAKRWANFELVRAGGVPEIPAKCRAVRIHAAGDFFNQDYFDLWLKIAAENPEVEFWAYTKSVHYWVNRLDRIPTNLILTASYGGRHDHAIELYKLKSVKVYPRAEDVPPGVLIDFNDDLARVPRVSFAFVDSTKTGKARQRVEGLL